jgi:hypothetical protein
MECVAGTAAPAASAKPTPSGPVDERPCFFACKSKAEQGQGKRSHSTESNNYSAKRLTRDSLMHVGSATAYQ